MVRIILDTHLRAHMEKRERIGVRRMKVGRFTSKSMPFISDHHIRATLFVVLLVRSPCAGSTNGTRNLSGGSRPCLGHGQEKGAGAPAKAPLKEERNGGSRNPVQAHNGGLDGAQRAQDAQCAGRFDTSFLIT